MKQLLILLTIQTIVVLSPMAHAGITPGSKNLGAIWFVGDSITQSNADGDPNGSPRKSLYDLLSANGYTFSFTGHFTANIDGIPDTGATPAENLYQFHSGVSGSVIGNNDSQRLGMTQNLPQFWTSGRLAKVKPNVILIMLGANDVNAAIDPPHAPARLQQFVNAIYAQPDAGKPTIFLASITPNRTAPPATSDRVNAFNSAIPGLVAALRSQGKDVRYVDQFTSVENAYSANMMLDNLHPNAVGNHTMAQQWFNAIASVVNGSTSMLKISNWNGYEQLDFTLSGRAALLVRPKTTAPGAPWIWRTEFFGHEPQADIALLGKGFHVAYINVQDLYGAPVALQAMDAYYDHVTHTFGLSKKPILEGMSRGGLFAFNWAALHPDRVAGLYVDAPVCDFKSWPGGKGIGPGSPSDWQKLLNVYGFTEAQALAYEKNPIDNLAPLAKSRIPILAVVGSADEVVPVRENIDIIEQRYIALSGNIVVIRKPGNKHHPHSLSDPTPIVNFAVAAAHRPQ